LQQWVVDGYLITLGALILIAGSLSDLFGRKQILKLGLIGFGVASVLCAVAPNGTLLIIMRALQGVAGALLVPSSLALIISEYPASAQGKAIGKWTAWTGIAFIIGPLLGGLLVDLYSWRLIFAVNVLPIAVTLWLMRKLKQVPSTNAMTKIDGLGALLCAIGLGGTVFALIEQSHHGWSDPLIFMPLIVGLVILGGFFGYEKKSKHPMLPYDLFKIRNFGIGNIATALIYAGLSVASFLIIVFIQQVGGYSSLEAGLALLPVTIIMFLLSPKFGALASRYGPRFFMTAGPFIAALGFLAFLRVSAAVNYPTQVLPGILLFGLGLSMTVAPLTAAILGSIDSKKAGIGSAINNAVARIAGLVAVAAIGIVVGPVLALAGFHRGVLVMALLLVIGAVVSGFGIQNPKITQPTASLKATAAK
jgi:EmrB/QacA subfamily drug resistance transporter